MSPRKPKLPPVDRYVVRRGKERSVFAVGVPTRHNGRVGRGYQLLDATKKRKVVERLKQEAQEAQERLRAELSSRTSRQSDEGQSYPDVDGPNYDQYDADNEGGSFDHDPITAGRSLMRPRIKNKYTNSENRKKLQQNWEKITSWLQLALIHADPLEDCDCPLQEPQNVHVISFEGFKTISYRYCNCGKQCAKLLEQGVFPSSPVRPRGFAFGESWRDLWESEYLQTLPSFYRELKNAYHRWRAVVSTASSKTLNELCGETVLEDHTLANMCPSCFAFTDNENDEDKVVYVAMDGNMQHSRYKDTHPEYEELPVKAFINVGVRQYNLASALDTSHSVGDGSGGPCGHNFKANGDWGRKEKEGGHLPSQQALDETGVFGMCCKHGILLRLLNMYSGERETHAFAILEELHRECKDAKEYRICYDLACHLSPAVKRIVKRHIPHISTKSALRVGRFHLYGHEYSCTVLWNPLRSIGWGQMIGEEMEPYWSLASHMVSSGRVMSSPRRTQRLDEHVLFRARDSKQRLGYLLRQRYERARSITVETGKLLDSILGTYLPIPNGAMITIDYLKNQMQLQEDYFKTYRKPRKDELEAVFASIVEEERQAYNWALQRAQGQPGWLPAHAQNIHPLTFEEMLGQRRGEILIAKTHRLMESLGQQRHPDWLPGGSQYVKYEEIYRRRELTKLRQRLVHVITSRNIQLHQIRSRVRGYKDSSRLVNQLNSKWTQLETVVKAYNKAAAKFRGREEEKPPPVTLKDLKEKGVTSELLWYLERSPAKEDWAMFQEVRDGIDAILKQERAREEMVRTPLEARRVVEWLVRGLSLIVSKIEDSNNRVSSNSFVVSSLWDRLKILEGLLKYCTGIILQEDDTRALFDIRSRARDLPFLRRPSALSAPSSQPPLTYTAATVTELESERVHGDIKSNDEDDETGSGGEDYPQEDEVLGDLLWNDLCVSERKEEELQMRKKRAALRAIRKQAKPLDSVDLGSFGSDPDISSDLPITGEDEEDL